MEFRKFFNLRSLLPRKWRFVRHDSWGLNYKAWGLSQGLHRKSVFWLIEKGFAGLQKLWDKIFKFVINWFHPDNFFTSGVNQKSIRSITSNFAVSIITSPIFIWQKILCDKTISSFELGHRIRNQHNSRGNFLCYLPTLKISWISSKMEYFPTHNPLTDISDWEDF